MVGGGPRTSSTWLVTGCVSAAGEASGAQRGGEASGAQRGGEASSAQRGGEASSAQHGSGEASSAQQGYGEASSATQGAEASSSRQRNMPRPRRLPVTPRRDAADVHPRSNGHTAQVTKPQARPANGGHGGAAESVEAQRVSGDQPQLRGASGGCTPDHGGAPGPHRGVVPDGLILGRVSEDLAKVAADEVDSYLDARTRKLGAASEMVDVGLGFHAAESSGRLSEDVPVSEFPAVLRFVEAAQKTLGNDPGIRIERLNIIIRRFSANQKLGWHRDAIGMFDEDIYGGVLYVGKPGPHGLTFRLQDSRFQAYEHAGAVLRSTGESRYQFVHGVEVAPDPSVRPRYSVTWRWFRLDFLAWHRASVSLRQRWPINFAATCLANGLKWSLVEAFLRRWQQSGEVTLFRGRNDACGPQLSPGQIDQVWWTCETKVPDAELVQWCAAICQEATQAGPRPWGGLDRRILPLLEVWTRTMPDPDAEPGSKRRRRSRDTPEPTVDSDQAELLASMGLPVDFSKRRRNA